MNTKRKNKSEYKIKFFIGVIICYVAFFGFYLVRADSISDISDSNNDDVSDETQKKIDELNRKAEIYRQIIEIKEKQGESLNNQLSITETNIQQVQSQLESTTEQVDDLNSQIFRLEQQIKEKDVLIDAQKKLLANIVQSYYEVSQSGPAAVIFSDGSIASFISNRNRLSQTGDKIKELVDSIIEIREDLQNQNDELDEKKTKLVEMQQKLQDQNKNLLSVKQQRQTLLSQTQGEEARYRDLLANVQKQKDELLNIDEFFASSGLSLDAYPKPSSSLFAPTSWYYSQRDSKWANENIGNTRTLMKNYGCAVTSVAMVFKQHGGSMDPGDLANEPIFSGDLINWPGSWSDPKLKLTSDGNSHGNISWSKVDSQIAKGNPVIVYIKKSNGKGGHYVVIHHKDSSTGKYVVHDPYFGPNIFLDTSRALIGAMGTSSSTSIDQMIIYN